MILHIKSPRLHQKNIKANNEFSKDAWYRINIQKSVSFLSTNSKQSKGKIKKAITLSIALKNITT